MSPPWFFDVRCPPLIGPVQKVCAVSPPPIGTLFRKYVYTFSVRCPPPNLVLFLEHFGSVLDFEQNWKSGKFQLARWSEAQLVSSSVALLTELVLAILKFSHNVIIFLLNTLNKNRRCLIYLRKRPSKWNSVFENDQASLFTWIVFQTNIVQPWMIFLWAIMCWILTVVCTALCGCIWRSARLYVSAAQLYVDAVTGCMVYASTRLPAKPPALVENKKWKKKFFRFISVTFAII